MTTFTHLALQTMQLIDKLQAQPAWALLVEISVVATIGAIYLKPIARFVAWLQRRRTAAIAALLKSKTSVASFTDTEIDEAVQRYIEPDTSNVDPADDDDLRNFAFVREPIFSVIERSLTGTSKTHLLVLADSGMGKTTLLLNLVARELKKQAPHRREIAVVPLGRADADNQIAAVKDKRNTILFLDALDEDVHAIEDHKARLHEIMAASADFKAVVLTCRTQFFLSDSDVPTGTGIARVGPKRAGTLGSHHFQRIYLLPFSGEQIDRYVREVTPWYRFGRRRRARALVSRVPELTIRPMLLALLPDLLGREKEFREIWELYYFMVKGWLTRESYWIHPDELLRASKMVAVDIYLGRQRRLSERLSVQEIATLLQKTSSTIETWKLTGRSLLNRDASGNYKFAHRSIMEFLFVLALVEGNDACGSVQWTDMMCNFFLSWGRSTGSTDRSALLRAKFLLEADALSKTGIFPLVGAYEPASRIDAQWVRRASGQSALERSRAGIPPMWREWTSRALERAGVLRLYEYSEGLVWQCVDMGARADAEIYRTARGEGVYVDDHGSEWTRPTLAEFCSLVQVLFALGASPLYGEDLYWLRDEDDQNLAMVRLRNTRLQAEPSTEFRENARLVCGNVIIGPHSALDVYAVPKVGPRRGQQRHYPTELTALQVIVWRGDAQQRWAADVCDTAHAWHVTLASGGHPLARNASVIP